MKFNWQDIEDGDLAEFLIKHPNTTISIKNTQLKKEQEKG